MYRSIEGQFWTDDKVRALTPTTKLLFLYLVTNPHTHVSGLYYLPMPLILHETKLTQADVEKGLNTLSIPHLAHYDHKGEVVWVVNMLRYQGRGMKISQSAQEQVRKLKHSNLIKDFCAHYGNLNIEQPIGMEYHINTPSPPYADQEQEQEQEQKKKETDGEQVAEVTFEMVVGGWNAIPGVLTFCLQKVQKGHGVHKRVMARLKEYPEWTWWEALFGEVRGSKFLCGKVKPWAASLHWVLGPENLDKVLQGEYGNHKPNQGGGSQLPGKQGKFDGIMEG